MSNNSLGLTEVLTRCKLKKYFATVLFERADCKLCTCWSMGVLSSMFRLNCLIADRGCDQIFDHDGLVVQFIIIRYFLKVLSSKMNLLA